MTTEDGRLRPDLIVNLPGGKNIVVDAKAPLAACLEAMEAGDDAACRAKLVDHARQIRDLEASGTQHEIEPLAPVENAPRQLQAPELLLAPGNEGEPHGK